MDFIGDIVGKVKRNILGYFKTKSTLGEVELEIIQDKYEQYNADATDRRVETGFKISDNVAINPLVISFRVVDNSMQYIANRIELKRMFSAGEPVTFVYAGRDVYNEMVITDLTEEETSKQAYGFTYDITLKQILTANVKDTDVKMNSGKAGISGGDALNKTAGVNSVGANDANKAKSYLKKIVG